MTRLVGGMNGIHVKIGGYFINLIKILRYTNLSIIATFVRESGRSREAIRPELKRFPTLHRWTWTLHEAAH